MVFSRSPISSALASITLLTITGFGIASVGTATATPGIPPSLVASDPTIAEPASDPFYTPPANIPDEPGTMIRSQFAPQLLSANTLGDTPGRADKILYTTSTQDGVIVATSGVVVTPAGKWTGRGPTPTIVYSPGTRGAGDDCAPSRSGTELIAQEATNIEASDTETSGNSDYRFYAAASALGIRVVVPDLLGLGTPGQHTYANHTEEGHSVLDAVRAGLSFVGAPADSPVAFFGYSQGGGAVAGAAEHAGTYAPELNIKGTFAGAPPADLDAVAGAIDEHQITGVLGYALNGAIARHPELTALQDEYFNEEGKRFFAATANECVSESGDNWGYVNSRTLTNDGRSFSDIVRSDERLRSVLLNSNYKLGTRALNAPMLIANGRNDDTIPWGQAAALAADYCALGGTVQFITDETPAIRTGSAINHIIPMLTQKSRAMAYLNDRFNDIPAPSDCGTL